MIFLCYRTSTLDREYEKPVASNRWLKQILLGRSLSVRSRWSRAANRSRSTSALRLFTSASCCHARRIACDGARRVALRYAVNPSSRGRLGVIWPALSRRRQWASTPTDLTHPTRPFSSRHVLFNATTKSGKCQRLPRLRAALCDFVLFCHQMPSLSPCQSSWLYDPLCSVLRWQLWSFAQPGRISIPATQPLRDLIDLMKYVRLDVRSRAATQERTLRLG